MARGLQTLNEQNKLALWAERVQACREAALVYACMGREHSQGQKV